MPEASNSPNQTPAPAAGAVPAAGAAPAPIKLQPKINGKVEEIDLSDPAKREEVTRYYQMGRNFETKSARLTELQNQMKTKEPLIKVADEMSEFFRTNPAGGRAFMQAYQALREGRMTPEQVMAVVHGQVANTPQNSNDGENGAPTSAAPGTDPQMRAMFSTLESKLNSIATQVAETQAATAADKQAAEIRAALGADDFLRARPETSRLVEAQIQARIGEGMSLDEATLLESQRIRTILSETATAERDRRLEGQEMRTVPPTAGIPPTRDFKPKEVDVSKAGTPEGYMKKKWEATRAAARDFARAAARAAVQGPGQ